MSLKVKVKLIDNKIGTMIPVPTYATPGSAGLDLRACIDADIEIAAGSVQLINTGIAIYIEDPNYAGMLLPRSGLGHKHGLVLGNLVGLIDSDYQGEIKISLWNRSETPYTLKVGEKLAQFVVVPIVKAEFNLVAEFATTSRAENGFGSTGRE